MHEVEKLILIATRIKGKGDTWLLEGHDISYPSITDTLEAYFQETKKKCDYKLCPLKGELYAIDMVEKEEIVEEPKTYNIYGE